MSSSLLPLRRLTPPVHLLRAFSTVARFGGVSRAAEALHLTQSAVSKQVQELDKWVGVPLFERNRKRLTLSSAGERYEKSVRALLSQLESATLELITSSDGGGALHLSTLPTFGAKWLIPKLPDFQTRHPQVTLHFVPYVQGYDFGSPTLDCAILFGDGHWPNTRAHYLTGREVVLIAPRNPEQSIRTPADVAHCTRLRHVTVPQAWSRWSETYGVEDMDPLSGPQFDQFQTIIRAVQAGMGVALVPRCLVQDEINAGLVSEPLPQHSVLSDQGYWLCYPETRANLTPLQQFRDWLLTRAEAAAEAEASLTASPRRPALTSNDLE